MMIMTYLRKSLPLSIAVFASLLIVGLCLPGVAQTPAVTIRNGEISLIGTIQSFVPSTGSLVLAASEFQLPNGKIGTIVPAKNKQIQVTSQTLIHDEAQTKRLSMSSLQISGIKVRVIGPDRGTGQTLQARDIIIFRPSENGASAGIQPEDWRENRSQILAKQIAAGKKNFTNPVDGAEMIFVPAGEFIIGSDEAIIDGPDVKYSAKPQHTVYLDGYWMYKYPVTVAQYRKFCDTTRREMPKEPRWGWQDAHPMVNVNWNDAVAYSEWAGVRLPTEAQWEKAARGGDGRVYPWGNDYDRSRLQASSKAAFDARSTAPVDSHPTGASPWGIHDMAGNVAEWCADWFDENYYQSAPSRNPTGPLNGEMRIFRGAAWYLTHPNDFRVFRRAGLMPGRSFDQIGFRCSAGP